MVSLTSWSLCLVSCCLWIRRWDGSFTGNRVHGVHWNKQVTRTARETQLRLGLKKTITAKSFQKKHQPTKKKQRIPFWVTSCSVASLTTSGSSSPRSVWLSELSPFLPRDTPERLFSNKHELSSLCGKTAATVSAAQCQRGRGMGGACLAQKAIARIALGVSLQKKKFFFLVGVGTESLFRNLL